MTLLQHAKDVNPKTVFNAFKYSVYLFILGNVYVFFSQEVVASVRTFGHGMSLSELGQAFAATIDTASWLVLLILFELETTVLSHERNRDTLRWLVHGLRGVCYVGILYSLWGYIAKVAMISGFDPVGVVQMCSLAGTDAFLALGLDQYVPIDLDNCGEFASDDLYRLSGSSIYAHSPMVGVVKRLAWVDAINGTVWVLVSVLLEIDVWLQLRGMLTRGLARASKVMKAILYSMLFAAAVYWGFEGDFVDFWDAFLWLVAFVFIEMNFFEWHAEEEAGAEAVAA